MGKKDIGLAVSGGGFRATLFHLGAFWRMNEIGYLKKIDRICSVSGGSITAAMLGWKWNRLKFNDQGVATNFDQEVVRPLQYFCVQNVDVPAILGGWLSLLKSPGDIITRRYGKLFKGAKLSDLPTDDEGPRFNIYATNMQTGVSFRFSRPYMGDYIIGLSDDPDVSLATAVAASSAFPPVLTPIMLDGRKYQWRDANDPNLERLADYRGNIYLSDGGVYDNMGLEAIWRTFKTVIVSDAGAPFERHPKPLLLKFSQLKKMLRVMDITINQTRALRKRHLIEDFKNDVRGGTYWGIATHINDYGFEGQMVKDNNVTAALKDIRTRLDPFSEKEQGQLINWGYALADTALRKHAIDEELPEPKWPMREYALD
jgi:NTE family protein